jgi:hypothetical protein
MQTTFTSPTKSQEELKAMFEKMQTADPAVSVEYEEEGVKKTTVLNMSEGLGKTLTFWAGQVLPDIPEVFTANSETNSSPRGKL